MQKLARFWVNLYLDWLENSRESYRRENKFELSFVIEMFFI